MKTIVVLSLGLVFCGLSTRAQTNLTSATSPGFVLPPIQLWEPRSDQEHSQTLGFALPAAPQFSTSAEHVTLNAEHVTLNAEHATLNNDDNEFHSRIIRSGQFYLTEPEPKSENSLVRAADAIWSPEVIKLGKTSVSCPLVTAIKRKNPLCLLNPLFFQLSW